MLKLLLDCGIFSKVEDASGNLYQISGTPVHELAQFPPPPGSDDPNKASSTSIPTLKARSPATAGIKFHRSPNTIHFVRSRMLYARPALKANGDLRLGLRHIHALNRCSDSEVPQHTLMLLKYIFPRQFKLHNVFTSPVDCRETAHKLKDYTIREQEISNLDLIEATRRGKRIEEIRSVVPKRLSGVVFELVQEIPEAPW